MKRVFNVIILIICVLSFASFCLAQPKKISEEEYNTVQRRHNPTGTNYRTRISSRSYQKSDGALISYVNQIREIMASGDSHTIIESRENDGYIQKTETYVIGETVYDLHPNGTWRVYPMKNKSYTPAPEPKSKPEKETTTEYVYKGRVMLQDKTADLYEIVQITKTKLKNAEQITKEIRKNWYDSNGRLIYSEWNTDLDKQTIQVIWQNEYDLKDLKFTPPVK